MRYNILGVVLVAGCIFSTARVWGQARPESNGPKYGSMEIAANFHAARANTVPAFNFWMKGGGVQVERALAHRWSLGADLSRLHTGKMPGTNVGLDLTAAVIGPRYSISSLQGRLKVYGQAMGGVARGSNSLFPNPNGATSSAKGAALMIGGGVNYRVSSRVYVRAIEADWLRTSLSNGTTTVQNNLRLSSGVVVRF